MKRRPCSHTLSEDSDLKRDRLSPLWLDHTLEKIIHGRNVDLTIYAENAKSLSLHWWCDERIKVNCTVSCVASPSLCLSLSFFTSNTKEMAVAICYQSGSFPLVMGFCKGSVFNRSTLKCVWQGVRQQRPGLNTLLACFSQDCPLFSFMGAVCIHCVLKLFSVLLTYNFNKGGEEWLDTFT